MASTSSYDADASSSSLGTSATLTRKAPKHDLTSLNSELVSHGWSKRPLTLHGLSERETSEAVGVMYEVIASALSNVENLDALAGRYRTLEYEQERTAKALSISRMAQRKAEGDAAGWKMRMTDLERRLALEEVKTRELREDVSRARKAVESVRVAAAQDQKKAAMRFEIAQAKIAKYASDTSLLSGPQGMTVLNTIASGRVAPTVDGQSALLEQSLRDLMEARDAIQQENEDFRHVVVSSGNALREALAISQGEKTASKLHHSQFFTLPPTLLSSPFATSLPPCPSYPEIADVRLKSLLASLSSSISAKIIRIASTDSSEPADPEEAESRAKAERDEARRQQDVQDRLKDLEVELECAKAREMEVRRTMEEMTARQMVESREKMGERERETGDLLEVLKEREKLEGERREVRALTMRFEKERKIFETERRAFEEERRRVDVDSILAQLPGTPSRSNTINSASVTRPSGPAKYDEVAPNCIPSSADSTSPSSGSESDTARLADSSSSSSTARSPGRSKPKHRVLTDLQTQRHPHQPLSPSPLSPHRPRTPKAHFAGAKAKRVRTPLSRLVLEKATRKGNGDIAVAAAGVSSSSSSGRRAESAANAGISAVGGVKALGEGGRKANTLASGSNFSVAPGGAPGSINALVKGKAKALSSAATSVTATAGTAKALAMRKAAPVPAPTSTAGARRLVSVSTTIGAVGSAEGSAVRPGGLRSSGLAVSGVATGTVAGFGKPVWR